MEDSENIKKLKELLATGYKLKQKEYYSMADPNSTSPLKVILIKDGNAEEMIFKGDDASRANLILELNS